MPKSPTKYPTSGFCHLSKKKKPASTAAKSKWRYRKKSEPQAARFSLKKKFRKSKQPR